MRHHNRQPILESLEGRQLLTGLTSKAAAVLPATAEVAPQFAVNHPPRLQLGNAPLPGSPVFDNFDQIELVWQTKSAGDGSEDAFRVAYRLRGTSSWQPASLSVPVHTDVDLRTMHSAVIRGLQWDTDYEYRVTHMRARSELAIYEANFRTRLESGDSKPFVFAAYGDSATPEYIESFRRVQGQINQHDVDFAMLLGDNIYPNGTHQDADGRFDPRLNPEAIEWNRAHIDYLAVGNHDLETPLATQQLFSVPIPVRGETSHVDVPENETAEFNYSFEYGDAHFTVIDSTMTNFVETADIKARIRNVVDFAVADMARSTATWKIVVAHNPFVGTDKSRKPDEFYFQTLMAGLNRVGVDLVLTGDSHTYSWTYPMSGFEDRDGNGMVTFEEVDFDLDPDRIYEKDAGLVQVVAGVGGRDFRLAEYTEPVFAAGYSLRDFTGPIEFGFAKLEVNQREIVVSYISAESGLIVGDKNGNGIEDTDEPFFGQFRIRDTSRPTGDLNGDGQLNALDVDLICALVATSGVGPIDADLVPDRQLNSADVSLLLRAYLGTQAGDVNLDGRFNSSDLVIVFAAGNYEQLTSETVVSWQQGDWNCDGRFDTRDLVTAFSQSRYVRF